jgi:predicted ester cyclase
MPAEDPKAVIRRWVEAWNAQDLDAAEELLAPEFVRHDANLPDVVGPRAERQHIADNLAAFPDLHFEIEQLIAEGDLVTARYLVAGHPPRGVPGHPWQRPAGDHPGGGELPPGGRQARRAVGRDGCVGPAPAARGRPRARLRPRVH